MTTDITIGSYASTWAIAGSLKYTAIARIDREICDSAPSRDSADVLYSVTIGRRQFLRRKSELRPLNGKLLKGRGD